MRQSLHIGGESGGERCHAAQHQLRVQRIIGHGEFGHTEAMRAVIVPQHQYRLACTVAFRSEMNPRRHGLREPARGLVSGEFIALVVGPRQALRVVKNHQAGVAIDHAGAVLDGDFVVGLGKQRQIGPGQRAHLRGVGTGRIHKHRRGDVHRGAVGAGHVHAFHHARCLTHALHASTHQLHTGRLRFLQQVHAQLLAAEPSASPRVQHRDDVVVHPRKVLADSVRIEKQVGATGHTTEAAVGTALIHGRVCYGAIRAHRTGALLGGALCIGHESLGRVGVARSVQIAAPVEPEAIVAAVGPLLQQVDAAIDQLHHGVIGARPPVAIRFGAFVAGERERRPFVHQQHVAHTVRHGERMRRCDAGNASPTDHHLGLRHPVTSRFESPRAAHRARSTITGVNARPNRSESCAERSRSATAYLA